MIDPMHLVAGLARVQGSRQTANALGGTFRGPWVACCLTCYRGLVIRASLNQATSGPLHEPYENRAAKESSE